MNRVEWLAERRGGMGATDVRRLLFPWDGDGGAAALFDEKTGAASSDMADPPPLVLMGLALEPLNASLYERRTGFRVDAAPPLSRNPAEPWQVASLDRTRADDGRPVELKYTAWFGDEWGEEYTDHVPPGYLVQTTWQMRVTGTPFADLSAIDGRGTQRVYRLTYDPALSDLLAVIAGDFWAMVRAGQRPEPGWVHPLAGGVIEQQTEAVAGRRVKLADPAASVTASEFLHFHAIRKEAERLEDDAWSRMVGLMGDAETAEAGPFLVNRKPRTRNKVKLLTTTK